MSDRVVHVPGWPLHGETPPPDASASGLTERLRKDADEITCYASTTTDYRPNASAALEREAAAELDRLASELARLKKRESLYTDPTCGLFATADAEGNPNGTEHACVRYKREAEAAEAELARARGLLREALEWYGGDNYPPPWIVQARALLARAGGKQLTLTPEDRAAIERTLYEQCGGMKIPPGEQIDEAMYVAGLLAGMERAAKICDAEVERERVNPLDRHGISFASMKVCAAAIRASAGQA